MRERLAFFITLLAIAGALAVACGGDGDGGANGNATPGVNATPGASATASPPPIDGGEATPRSFAEARDRLSGQLQAIGANIGAVPDDIQEQILERCRALEEFADTDAVEGICQAIDQAIESNDPGLIDRVLDQLAELEED